MTIHQSWTLTVNPFGRNLISVRLTEEERPRKGFQSTRVLSHVYAGELLTEEVVLDAVDELVRHLAHHLAYLETHADMSVTTGSDKSISRHLVHSADGQQGQHTDDQVAELAGEDQDQDDQQCVAGRA